MITGMAVRCRRGVFNDEMLTRCEEIMRKVCEDVEAELKGFDGERDHVHLLVHYPPKVAVSKLVNSLKGASARRIRLGAHPGRRLGESSPEGSTAPSCTGTCGRPPTSPCRTVGRRWPLSASTSSCRNVHSKMHVRAVLRRIHPRCGYGVLCKEPGNTSDMGPNRDRHAALARS